MKGFILFVFAVLLLKTNIVYSADGICGKKSAAATAEWMKQFHLQKNDYDVRAKYAVCLIRHDFAGAGVAQAILKTIKNEATDLIFREDLILAISQASFRKKTAVDSELVKPLSENDKQAVDRTVASAGVLLDVAGSVKKIDHIFPVTDIENELLSYLSSVIKDGNRDVQTRIVAMQSLVTILSQIMKSGVYSEPVVKQAIESIRFTASQSDNASHYTRAKDALRFLGVGDQNNAGRSIASVSKK